jgi:predicted transcriptional regulator
MATAAVQSVAAFDAVNRVPARCETIGISQNFLAQYVGISKSDLSKALSKGLGGELSQKLDRALVELESLAGFFQIVPLSFDDPDQIRELVRGFGLMHESEKERLQSGLAALSSQK